MSGTISADRQGWWKCSKIVWNNLCHPCSHPSGEGLKALRPYVSNVTKTEVRE
ncbi:MAG: hypothetical protein HFP76_00480 [Methylococcales symbiont of Iophon sp. n. MRB-2018]|nr:MAG: hypothetical protein HFP76_00480 [Methylococcales symbiont of Iophon sp. n. MRB-2018]